jgi:hypothetical protein
MDIMDKEAAEADLRDRILDWHDGCAWDGRTRVLNLWPVLNFFPLANLRNAGMLPAAPLFWPVSLKNANLIWPPSAAAIS